jgi:hypothetical protein
MSWRFLAEGALPALKSRPRSRTSFAVAETHLPRAVSVIQRTKTPSSVITSGAPLCQCRLRPGPSEFQEIFLSLSVLA